MCQELVIPKGMDEIGNYGSNVDVAVGKVPYRDFMHFSGDTKPWIQDTPSSSLPKDIHDIKSSTEYWFYILNKLNTQLPQMNLDLSRNLNLKHLSMGHKMTVKLMVEAITV